jgi:hypothetical protein
MKTEISWNSSQNDSSKKKWAKVRLTELSLLSISFELKSHFSPNSIYASEHDQLSA